MDTILFVRTECIYTMPCTLVTLDFQRARAFHGGLCKMYCTVPFSSCVTPRPLFASWKMYLSVCFLHCLKSLQLILGAASFCQSIFVKLHANRGDTFPADEQGRGLLRYMCVYIHFFYFLSSHLTFDLSWLVMCLLTCVNHSNISAVVDKRTSVSLELVL